MKFEEALRELRDGKMIYRPDWDAYVPPKSAWWIQRSWDGNSFDAGPRWGIMTGFPPMRVSSVSVEDLFAEDWIANSPR